jgi:flagellar biosynthesis protein FlhA
MLAKNLITYGNAGEVIPEVTYRDVSLVFSRLGTQSRQQARRLQENQPAKFIDEKVKGKKLRHEAGGMQNGKHGAEENTIAECDALRLVPIKPARVNRPLSVEMGAALFTLSSETPSKKNLLAKPLAAIQKKIVRLLGVTVPDFFVSCNPKLKNDEYRILFKGLEAGRGRLELGWYYLMQAQTSELNDSFLPDYFSSNKEYASATPDLMNKPENIISAAKAVCAIIVRHVSEIIERRCPELLGRDEVQAILDAAEENYPVVTGEVKSLLPLGIIREVLQGLVSEQVSIRPIAVILETLADWATLGPAPVEVIIEQIRQSLRRQICLEYADDKLTLRVLTLEEQMDNDFAAQQLKAGSNRTTVAASWENLITTAVNGMEKKGFPPVILCSPKARLQLKEITRSNIPNLAVLSYMEIPPDITVEQIGQIGNCPKS